MDDKDIEHAEPATQPAAEPVGKVVVDGRGRNVWRWARDVIESTSVLLKRLENKDLALEPTQKVPIVPNAQPAQKSAKPAAVKSTDSKAGGAKAASSKSAARHPALQGDPGRDGSGFDPYNSR